MNVLELFKKKKFVKLLSLIVAAVLTVVVALSIMLPSFLDYNAYYTAAMAAKEEQKRLDALPLEFLGIEAQLSDSVLYVNNGRAKPVEDDFIVKANFTEKGKDFSKILKPDEYTISAPDNFVTSGGTVVVEYIYQPEKAEGATEEPEAIKSTAKLNLTLADIELVKLDIIEKPYRIYYAEGMAFNPEGMVVQATYNDGSKLTLEAEDVVASDEPLVAGAESAVVDFQGVTANVPVTVVSAATYDDGKVTTIDVEGEIYIEEGQSIDVNPVPVTVRGTYLSGNRLILDEDQYTITSISGNEGVPADYAKRYIITATLNGALDITDSYITYVKKAFEVENATLDNSLAEEVVMNYVYKNDTFIQDDNVTAVKAVNGKTITFNVTASQTIKSEFRLAMASTTVKNGGFASVALNDIMSLTVNGMPVGIPASSVIEGIETVTSANQNKAVFGDYRLGGLPLTAGDNEIVITFKNITSSTRVYLDKIGMVTGGKGPISGTIGAYLVNSMEKGIDPKLEVTRAINWNALGITYVHGLCSDGENLYFTSSNYAAKGTPRNLYIVKYNMDDGTKVRWNSPDKVVIEASAGLSYKDGKIIFFCTDGTRKAINAATFSPTSTAVDYNGYEFKEWSSTDVLYAGQANESPVILADVYYNEYLDKYAVMRTNANESEFKLRIYNGDKQEYADINIKSVSGAHVMRMTGSSEYIYINYSADGKYEPIIQIYDWNGEYIGESVIPNTHEIMGGTEYVNNITRTNTQGLVFHKNKFYIGVLRFGQDNRAGGFGDANCIIEVKMAPDALTGTAETVDYTLGEYVAAVENYNANLGSGETAKAFTVTAAMLENGFLPVSAGEVKDIVFDGKNYYVSATQEGGRIATVYQINSKSMSITGMSKKLAYDDCLYGNNSKLCIMEDTLYMMSESGKSYAIKLADFKNGCELTLVPSEAGVIGAAGDISYNEDSKRGVILSQNTLTIVDTTSQYAEPVVVDLTAELAAVKAQYAKNDVMAKVTVGSVANDEKYVYVSYKVEGATDIALTVYDYNGNKVNTTYFAAAIDEMPTKDKTYQVSSVFMQDGKLMALVTNTVNGTGYIFAIKSPAAI